VTTEGFIALSPRIHSNMDRTQYIAPLKADFDLSASKDARIRYLENSDSLTVQWYQLPLKEAKSPGNFTFQATLKYDGDIIFVYESLPDVILSSAYFVSGISDAFVKGSNLYEYHRVNVALSSIRNRTVVKFKARETCNNLRDCNSCLTSELPTFECLWCPSAKQCSSGMDRMRQRWEDNQCHLANISEAVDCASAVPENGPKNEHREFYNVSFVIDGSEARKMWVESPLFVPLRGLTAHKVALSFSFPYYGHQTHVLFIFPSFGVVSIDAWGLNFLTHGRYMTPLLARYKLIPNQFPKSRFAYLDDGSRFVAEWREVYLSADHTLSRFSFQGRDSPIVKHYS
jgi:hypothetical protein